MLSLSYPDQPLPKFATIPTWCKSAAWGGPTHMRPSAEAISGRSSSAPGRSLMSRPDSLGYAPSQPRRFARRKPPETTAGPMLGGNRRRDRVVMRTAIASYTIAQQDASAYRHRRLRCRAINSAPRSVD